MRMQFRFLLYFIPLLMFLFSSSIIAKNWELVDITIPAWEDVTSKSQYTHPTKEFANKMTDWSDDCVAHADYLDTQMKFLVAKRDTASAAASGGINWRSKAINVASKSYWSLLEGFIRDLENAGGKIGREQLYAAACIEVNTLYPTLSAAMAMMDSMHAVAVEVRKNYKLHNTSISDLDSLRPKIDITLPSIETPEWLCKGNNALARFWYGTVTCEEKWNTPFKALNIHRVWCGGDKEPNPGVSGCNLPYYTCQPDQVKVHQVLYCHRGIDWNPPDDWRGTKVGICGEAFRKCPGSLSRAGVHDYRPVTSTNNGNSYWSGYEVHPYHDIGIGTYTETDHSGSSTPPVASSGTPVVHGSSGVGVSQVIPDKSPNCNSCIDGSSNCPNASNHSSSSAAASLSPSDSNYAASAGSTHTASLSLPSVYSSIYWYVKSPSESGLGTSVQYVSGDGSSTSATFSYTFPSDASGDYVITAYTYLSDWSVVQPSYTVTVGSNPTPQTPEPSTPSYHACGSHETWQSGDHSAAGCGTSGHYVCDGSDHSYTYCYVTDSNGNTCTVGGYYACQSHMHQYPEPQSQYMTCAYGHTYDTTVQSQVDFHRTKTCKWCGGTWKDCGDVTPYCPTWTTAHHKCSEPSHTCDLCD